MINLNEAIEALEASGELKTVKTPIKLLIGVITGTTTISLNADPYRGRDHNITIVVGPPNTALSSIEKRKRAIDYAAHQVRLGQMYYERNEHKKTTGVVLPRSVRPFKIYDHICTCGHVDMISTLNMVTNLKCSKCGSKITDQKLPKQLIRMNQAVKAQKDGVLSVEQAEGSFVKCCLNGRLILSAPKERIVKKWLTAEKVEIHAGEPIVSGFVLKTPQWEKAGLKDLLNQRIKEGFEGDFNNGDVVPLLVGVFKAGQAPGNYTMTQREAEFAAKYQKAAGVAVETRPYHLLKGLPGLKCYWRWLIKPLAAGWVDIAQLHKAPNGAEWDPGYSRNLLFYR